MNEAIQALLALGGYSLQTQQIAPDTVAIQVASVKRRDGLVMMPLTYNLEVSVEVHLDLAHRWYTFTTRTFESSGMSMSVEVHHGPYRHRQFGVALTLDGVKSTAFDTGIVLDLVDQRLQPLGWQRKPGAFSRLFKRDRKQ